jgi:hypothetical protein
MLPWPKALATLMSTVAPLFTKQVWQHVQLLRVGAIRAPGKRPITAAWQVMGLAHAKAFEQDHRVLNRAVWSSLRGSRLVRLLLVHLRAPRAPLGLGLDETLERRRGAQIQAQGMYRAPVRSAPSHRVNARGWRWLSLLLSVPIAWAKRGWAVPFVTVLAPSERYHRERGQRHKKRTDWARQMCLVVVTDSRFAVMTLLERVRQLPHPLCGITRLRWAAARYEPAPPRTPRQHGRPGPNGQRLPTLAQALAQTATRWHIATVRGWYGAVERVVELVSATAVW